MNYRIERTQALPVILKKERFASSGTEFPSNQVGQLWQRCRQDGTVSALCGCAKDGPFGNALLGICFNDPSSGDFDYAVGAAYDGQSPIPDGLSLETFPAETWAAFRCVGKMPGAFEALMKQIYTEFFPTSEYQPSGGPCLEVYFDDQTQHEDYTCEIWLPVKSKK